jgi:glycosyltransferase involved in cell wall biosynthesis
LSEANKIHLLVLTPTLECGGAERYVAWLCNNINKNKFRVTLLVVNNTAAFFKVNDSIAIINLKKSKSVFAILTIIKIINQQKPAIVYSTANHLNLLLAIAKPFIVSSTHLVAWETSIVSINHKFSSYPSLYNFLLKKFYKKLPLVICQSNYMRQDLIKNYGFTQNQTQVIYTGVDVPEHSHVYENPNCKIFLSVARLSPEKQIDKILKALSLLTFPFKYIIIGSGVQMESLKKLVVELNLNTKVEFKGQLEKPYKGVGKVDLFLMASKYEGLPTTLIEATMLGIPIVSTNSPGGIAEIVADEHNGFLVRDNTSEALAATIEKALSCKFNGTQIAATAYEKYSADKCLQKMQQLFFEFSK